MRWMAPLLILLAATAAQANDKIYTWVDENGGIHFGDRPPTESKATEVKVQGFRGTTIEVDPEQLPGNWQVVADNGVIQDWRLTIDGRVQMEYSDAGVRSIVTGEYSVTGTIMTVTTDLIQRLSNNKLTTDDAPTQMVYKFLEFSEDQFKVYHNSGNLTANRK